MMRIMKLIHLPLVLAILACGDDAPQADSPATEAAQAGRPLAATPADGVAERVAPAPDETAMFTPAALKTRRLGDLDAMVQARMIRVLTVYGLGRYYLDDGQEKGLVKESADRLQKFINRRYERDNVKVHVVIIPVARNQLIPALLEGRGDIIDAGLTITGQRRDAIDFSIPVTKALSEILVTGPSAPALSGLEDLSGREVFVRESSSYRQSVAASNERLLRAGKAPIEVVPVTEVLEDDDLIEMVNGGLLPWAIVDDYKLQLWDGVFNELVVRKDIVFRSGGRIGWAFRRDSPLLREALNEFLAGIRQGTLIGNILINRYIRDFDWSANALEAEHYGRFAQLEEIFRKYGEQYGIEYLRAAAQGYQESRLDQSARSDAGAIGVMQLLPSTAADPKVGIHNIDEVDANIHAGVKYVDYLRDRYFSDPDIDTLNRTLLALAAYNAGPARMINLRRKAAQQGYDPNVWFDNVELIAAQEIGRETVQYVANIYKYYLAYRMSAAQGVRRQAARQKAGIEQE